MKRKKKLSEKQWFLMVTKAKPQTNEDQEKLK